MALTRYAESEIPTRHGRFRVVVYRDCHDNSEHLAIVRGNVEGEEGVLCRVHSECWTSEVLGSLKCDCREQLERSLDAIAQAGRGVIVYLRQEGRGIGLGNKIRAYALQEAGLDTVEANLELGFAPDLRRYDFAAKMLGDLGVRSVALMTNNPEKIRGLENAGVRVIERVSHWSPPNEHNADYLEVKREKMGHLPEVLDVLRSAAWQTR
jgi:GTP cyclohydrolase II/3,4-dihydroxy 2-butanone 4-phosphate synthase/GTP cyclohydrolase II